MLVQVQILPRSTIHQRNNMSQKPKYTIETGVSLPKLGLKTRIYPWNEMEVGDSFVAPISVRRFATLAGQRIGMKFSCRKINEDEVRIWRIK
jgi:hypothetical protein